MAEMLKGLCSNSSLLLRKRKRNPAHPLQQPQPREARRVLAATTVGVGLDTCPDGEAGRADSAAHDPEGDAPEDVLPLDTLADAEHGVGGADVGG